MINYVHVDVFSPRPFTGNSLTVFPDSAAFSAEQMLAVTREMRHFESIFLISGKERNTVHARVFDLLGELDFAGHPLLGAACVLHEIRGGAEGENWSFVLRRKTVTVATERRGSGYSAVLDQGRPEFLGTLAAERRAEFAAALGLAESDLSSRYPLEVVSTGLLYLVVPIESGLERAGIRHRDFEALLATVGAEFAYLLDVNALEGRHWNNDGLTEDVATGSGAGTVGAYAVKHGLAAPGEEFILHQGRFTGRPSRIRVRGEGSPSDVTTVLVGGDVALVGRGTLLALPAAPACS
jgi:trans-2,3-dihydro-3-hydroxyanthranilate isomerase